MGHKRLKEYYEEEGDDREWLWKCSLCGDFLRDDVADWDTILDFDKAEEEFSSADLCIVLGTSLKLEPACNLPVLTKENNNGTIVLVNLQKT